MGYFRTAMAKDEFERAAREDPALAAAYDRIVQRVQTNPMAGTRLFPVGEPEPKAPILQALVEFFTCPPKKLGGQAVYATTEEVTQPAPGGVLPRTHAVAVYVPDWVPEKFAAAADRTILDFGHRDWSKLHWRV